MSSLNIVSFDFDDTLCVGGKMNPKAVKLLNTERSDGNHIIIITARSDRTIHHKKSNEIVHDFARQLGINDVHFVGDYKAPYILNLIKSGQNIIRHYDDNIDEIDFINEVIPNVDTPLMFMEDKKKLPFTEDVNGSFSERVFNKNSSAEDLIWHRDKEDREILVLESKNWLFQMDNQLPVELKPGDKLSIPKNTYHRIIKGDSDLVVRITKII